MKRISSMMCGIAMLFSAGSFAQGSTVEITSEITPLAITVAYNKTTNLIFPYGIKSVDKGSNDVLVQKAKGAENVLQIKAAKPAFEATNLSVITADGQLYAFTLAYDAQPLMLNFKLGISPGKNNGQNVIFSSSKDNEAKRDDAAEIVSLKKPVLNGHRDSKFEISMSLAGLYAKDDVFYFQIVLDNSSNVNYDIDQLRFYVRDEKKAKRTASQEIELIPLNTTGNNRIIRPGSKQTIVISLSSMTIPDQKFMSIELIEAQGGRNLAFKVSNRDLIRAIRL